MHTKIFIGWTESIARVILLPVRSSRVMIQCFVYLLGLLGLLSVAFFSRGLFISVEQVSSKLQRNWDGQVRDMTQHRITTVELHTKTKHNIFEGDLIPLEYVYIWLEGERGSERGITPKKLLKPIENSLDSSSHK